MPGGIWYGPFVQGLEENASEFDTADLRMSMVSGPLGTLNPDHATINDFLGTNGFVTGATDIAVPTGANRLSQWEGSGSAGEQASWMFGWSGKLTMGSPTGGTNVGGFLLHDGPITSPGTSKPAWIETVSFTANGQAIGYGDPGENWVGKWACRQNERGKCGRGGIDSILSTANEWNAGTTVGYSLVTAGDWDNFGVDALFLANFNGLQYATNCAPGEAAYEFRNQGQREQVAYSPPNNNMPFRLLQSTDILFEYANGLQTGEVIIGVIEYIWTGSPSSSRILRWDDVTPNITIQLNQDLLYGNVSQSPHTTTRILRIV